MQDNEAHHKNRATAIESSPVCVLPDVLNSICVPSHKSLFEIFKSTFYRFRVPFKCRFSPSHMSIGGLNTDEEPAWGQTKELVRRRTR